MSKKHIPVFEGIDTLIIRVSNYLISKKWYEEKLGLVVIFEDHNSKLVAFETGSPTSLTIWQTNEKPNMLNERSAYPVFRTNNAEKAYVELSRKNVKTEPMIEVEGIKFFRFFDPDGNLLEACEATDE